MGLSIALTFFGSILALVVGTSICYFGDGCYYHRQRLDFIPKAWAFIWFTGAFVGCAFMEEAYPVVYCISLAAALVGWGIGWVLLDALWEPACERLKNKVERQCASRAKTEPAR